MNNYTKLLFALEHIAHLEDLFKNNSDGALLGASLRDIKIILERQLNHHQYLRSNENRSNVFGKRHKL
tara:strand:- start:166 stop:369 length:204 start_codon:yes stop_codon:yes gene_type:complete